MFEKARNLDSGPHTVKNPEINKRYWVECEGYQCMAIRDDAGKWTAIATGKEVTGVVKVYQA